MIKLKIFNMHMGRNNVYDGKSFEEDKAFYESVNNLYTMDKSYTWKDIQLTYNDDYDYALAIDSVHVANYLDPKKTILFRCEPKLLRDRFDGYNNLIDPSKYLKVFDMCCLWGWLGLDYVTMHNDFSLNKSKVLSSIISANNSTEMHGKRFYFLNNLDSLTYFDHYGDNRGMQAFQNLRSHKGKVEGKIDGLRDYKYHFNAENSREIGYFSEKFIDALISECLVFYDGCLNMEDYFDTRCFIRVDLNDYEKSMSIIKTSIESSEWEKRIDIIKAEKLKALENFNILEMCHKTIHGKKMHWEK